MKLLLYCTKSKPYLYKTEDTTYPAYPIGYYTDKDLKVKLSNTNELANLNGKIVAECDFEVEEIIYAPNPSEFDRCYFSSKEWCYDFQERNGGLSNKELLEKSCLTNKELSDYLNTEINESKKFIKDTFGYAIHVKNLHIFDKPKELNEVYKIELVGDMLFTKSLEKAPQNMMRVSINNWNYATYNPDDIRVLISIRPEWLYRILNGEKTIEVRKKVVRGMLDEQNN